MNTTLHRLLAVAALLTLSAESVQADDSCKPAPLATLAMTSEPSGLVDIPVTLRDKPLHMLVDTGGSISILAKSTATALGLPQHHAGRLNLGRYGGETISDYVLTFDSVLGAFRPGVVPFFLAPDDNFPANVQGLISAELLHRYDIEFDFAGQKFSLYRHDYCEAGNVYWTRAPFAQVPFDFDRDRHIRVAVQLDGREIKAIVDTGAQKSTGSLEDILGEFGVTRADPAFRNLFNDDSGVHVYHYPFKTLVFDGIVVNNPDIDLYPNSVSLLPFNDRELVIGMNVLRKLHIFISYGDRTMYATPADAH